MQLKYTNGNIVELIDVPNDLEITPSLQKRLGGRNEALLHMNLFVVTAINDLSRVYGIKIRIDSNLDFKQAFLNNLKKAADKKGLLYRVEDTETGVSLHPVIAEAEEV